MVSYICILFLEHFFYVRTCWRAYWQKLICTRHLLLAVLHKIQLIINNLFIYIHIYIRSILVILRKGSFANDDILNTAIRFPISSERLTTPDRVLLLCRLIFVSSNKRDFGFKEESITIICFVALH